MRITKAMFMALTHIEWITKEGEAISSFSRAVDHNVVNRLLDGGLITPYPDEEWGKPVTRFKLTPRGEELVA